MRTTPERIDAEHVWAAQTVRRLGLPRTATEDDLLTAVSRAIERELLVVPTAATVTNGALEDWPGGALAVRVPATSAAHRRHLVCRGAARALYRQPGARDGRPSYTDAVEREVEYAAMAMAACLDRADAARR